MFVIYEGKNYKSNTDIHLIHLIMITIKEKNHVFQQTYKMYNIDSN